MQHHYTHNTTARQITTDINTLTLNIPHHSFLSSFIVLKILTSKASSATMIPSPRRIYSVT